MQEFIDFFSHLTNPEWIIQNGGLYIVVFIVFIETGLFFGFFFQGHNAHPGFLFPSPPVVGA